MSELYKLPDGWEWYKLGELCNFIRGPFGGSLKKNIFKENGNAVYEQSHAIYNQFEKIRYFIDDEKFEEMKRFELRAHSLIMSCSGTIGKVAIVPNNIKKGIINQALLMLTPNNKLNNIFLKLLMESNFFQNLLSENSTGAAIANVASVKVLKEIKIPIPPVSEQQRIVSKLDLLFEKIDKSIALHQKNMHEANLFMGSVLNDVFGEMEAQYEKRTLESFNKKMSSGGTPSRKEKKYWDGSIEWFSSGELNQLYTLPSKEKITQIGLDNTSAKLFQKGTLLIGMYDTAAMKMSILSNEGSCNQAIVGFKPKEDELNVFFAKYQLEYLKKEILEQRQGVRQQNLNLSKVKNVEIEYPPLPIQQKTVKYLDEISEKIEKIKSVQKEKMESLKALKVSILDSAFRGEL